MVKEAEGIYQDPEAGEGKGAGVLGGFSETGLSAAAQPQPPSGTLTEEASRP